MKIRILLSICFLINAFGTKAQNSGNGSWGSISISTTTTIDGSRAAIEEINFSGTTVSVKLNASQFHGSNWAAGQRVLIMVMAKSGSSPTRNWQIMTMQSWTPSTLTLTTLNFPHTNWPSGTLNPANAKMQAIIVPQYIGITVNTGGVLTCTAWDGFTGGVLAFLANNSLTISNGGWLDVSSKGYSNLNNAGTGGSPGTGGIAPGPNTGGNPSNGENGDDYDFDVRPKGQCYSPLPNLSGGDGGTGGVKIKGLWGAPGSAGETRMSLARPAAPKLLALGNAGAQGRGGRGGDGGGSGANGGNGAMAATGTPTNGNAGAIGGDGGAGGTGGGVIIALAANISIPHTNNCIDISGTDGGNGTNGITLSNGGEAGNGADGGDAGCGAGWVGYGGFGSKGQRGNGSAGGNGGGGGSIGSFSIRTISPSVNPLSKTQHVKYNRGLGGAGGLGGAYYPFSALDGRNGYVNDPSSCNPNAQPCERRVYDVYPCAAHEAYQALADMDWAIDYGYYIEFRRRDGKGNSKKGAKLPFAMMDTDYYCLYFKCSKLIMAFEPNGTKPIPVYATNPTNGYTGIDYYAVTHNVYWCTLDDTTNITANCHTVHSSLENDINLGNLSISPGISFTGSATHPVSLLTHDFGQVLYGMDMGGGIQKYVYTDLGTTNIFGNGYVNFNTAGGIPECFKKCTDDTFRFDWVRRVHCSFPFADVGGGGGYPNYAYIPEVFPRMPFIPALWDNPEEGKPGEPGDEGDGDDTFFEGGDTGGGGGDDEPEAPIYQNLNDINRLSKYAVIAPNPVSTELIIRLQQPEYGGATTISIKDINGKTIRTVSMNLNYNKAESIGVQNLSTGVYFIELIGVNYKETLKFVKQ